MSGRADAIESVPGLRELVRRQAWLARRDQLAGLGVGRHHVAAQLAARRWREVAPTVLALTTGWLTPQQQRWLAVLNVAGPAWISGLTGLEVHGLQGWSRAYVAALVTHGCHPPRLPRIQYHESRRPPGEPPELSAGLPLAPPARCAVDAAGWEQSARTAQGLLIAVVQQRVATVGDLREAVAATGRLRHRRALVAALADADAGSESLAEVDVAALVRTAGLPEPRRQEPGIDGLGGRRRRDLEVDLPDGTVLVIQVDGTAHFAPQAIWDDQLNDAGAAATGKLVLRVPVAVARTDPGQVIASLVRIRREAERRAMATPLRVAGLRGL